MSGLPPSPAAGEGLGLVGLTHGVSGTVSAAQRTPITKADKPLVKV
jgi:hypothetical protein